MDDRPRDLPPVQYQDSAGRPARRRRGWLPWLILALLLIAVGAVIWYAVRPGTGGSARGRAAAAGQPQPVGVAAVHTGDMPVTYAGLGTVTPISTVMVQSQISGQIMQIAFKEGQQVKPGDFLIQIDPRPYQVALEQAEGTLAHDRALLADAKLDLARYQTLLSQDSIASQTVDTQRSLVHQYEGSVTTDQGLIDSAKLNLVYCHITSPIGGRVGLQQVNLGNYITPAETNGLVVVTQLQPITVVFTLAEDDIPSIQKRLHAGATLPVTVRDRANKNVLGTGTLETIDNQIDTTTGTVKLKAMFDNPDETLFPNQFVNAELLLDTIHDALLVPQAGIQNGAPGSFVYLLQPNGTVSIQKVVLGVGDSNNVVVTSGLKAGDQIVVDGADRLKDGAKVTVPAAHAAAATGSSASDQPAAADQPAGADQQQHHHHRRDAAGNGTAPNPSSSTTTQQPAPQP
jgi:multidrug efflux system membrane fusion protein